MALILMYESNQAGPLAKITFQRHLVQHFHDPDQAILDCTRADFRLFLFHLCDTRDSRTQYVLMKIRDQHPDAPFILVVPSDMLPDHKVLDWGFQSAVHPEFFLQMMDIHQSASHLDGINLSRVYAVIFHEPLDESLFRRLICKLIG